MEWGEIRHFKLGNMRTPDIITLGASIKGRGAIIYITSGILSVHYAYIKLQWYYKLSNFKTFRGRKL